MEILAKLLLEYSVVERLSLLRRISCCPWRVKQRRSQPCYDLHVCALQTYNVQTTSSLMAFDVGVLGNEGEGLSNRTKTLKGGLERVASMIHLREVQRKNRM